MGNRSREVIVCSDPVDLSRRAARQFVDFAKQCVAERGRFTVCLSGGSTPRQMYALLAEEPFLREAPWSDIHIFWGDERVIPLDQPDNHYRMASDIFLTRVPIPQRNVHRMPVESDTAAKAADQYENLLKTFFDLAAGELPRFDLIILGMGADGHTASLFPGTPALNETTRFVAANYVPKLAADRLTLTVPVLNEARQVMFLVSGRNKADALQRVLQNSQPDLPAAAISPKNGNVFWIVDEEAASGLQSSKTAASEGSPQ